MASVASDGAKQAHRDAMAKQLRAIDITVTIIASLFVCLRFWSRLKSPAGAGLDDWLILAALAIAFVNLAMNLIMIANGLGLQATDVSLLELSMIGKAIYADEIVYVVNLALIKVSILLTYCRIFVFRSFKIGAWVLGTLTVLWSLIFIFVCIFQCNPIARAWNPTIPGKCLYLRGIFIGNAVPNILTDVAILLMPMYHVWHLNARFIQRLTITCIFLLGCFVIFASIYRFVTILQLDQNNISYTLKKPTTWSHIEVVTALVSACLPTMRPLLTRFLNVVGLGSKDRSTGESAGWGSGPLSRSGRATDNKAHSRGFTVLTDVGRSSQSVATSEDQIVLKGIKVQTDIDQRGEYSEGDLPNHADGRR